MVLPKSQAVLAVGLVSPSGPSSKLQTQLATDAGSLLEVFTNLPYHDNTGGAAPPLGQPALGQVSKAALPLGTAAGVPPPPTPPANPAWQPLVVLTLVPSAKVGATLKSLHIPSVDSRSKPG